MRGICQIKLDQNSTSKETVNNPKKEQEGWYWPKSSSYIGTSNMGRRWTPTSQSKIWKLKGKHIDLRTGITEIKWKMFQRATMSSPNWREENVLQYLRLKIIWKKDIRRFHIPVDNSLSTAIMQIIQCLSYTHSHLVPFLPTKCTTVRLVAFIRKYKKEWQIREWKIYAILRKQSQINIYREGFLLGFPLTKNRKLVANGRPLSKSQI